MKKYLCIFLIFCCAGTLKAQPIKAISGLKIGDQVPDITIDNILNYPAKTAKLSDFKGKLLILDFWATWCGPCVAMIPTMDSLQHEFNGKVQFLPVASQSGKVVSTFLKSFEKSHHHQYSLPDVVDDKVLTGLFPHSLNPHYVWIGKDGKVVAFTSAYEINAVNIQKLINGNEMNATMKVDIDLTKPLFSGPSFPENNLLDYTVFFHGRLEGTGNGVIPRKNEHSIGVAWTNQSILYMYERCADRLIKNYNRKKLILNVRDSSRLIPPLSKAAKDKWNHDEKYSLDVIVPLKDSLALNGRLLATLNLYTDYTSIVESRQVKCLQLTVNGDTLQFNSKSDRYNNQLMANHTATHIPVAHFISWMNGLKNDWPIITDHTGFKGYMNIAIHADPSDFKAVQAELQRQGLVLTEKEEDIDILVIRDKTFNK